MKPFRLKVRIYNNRLVRAREELQLTQRDVARRIGVSPHIICYLENCKHQAWGEFGWTPSAQALADFYGYSPEYLWPEEIAAVRKNALSLEVAAGDIPALLPPDEQLSNAEMKQFVGKAYRALPPVQRDALMNVTHGEDLTLKKIGEHLDLSRERTRQIREDALRRLRHEIGKVA